MRDGLVTGDGFSGLHGGAGETLTNDRQHPQIPVAGGFDLGLVLARVP